MNLSEKLKSHPFLSLVTITTILAIPLIPPMLVEPHLTGFDKLGRALIVYIAGCAAAYYLVEEAKLSEVLIVGFYSLFVAGVLSPFIYFGFEALNEL